MVQAGHQLMETGSQNTETQFVDHVIIRFAGDSGDGIQLTGGELTKLAAESGNDISTFPDYPAEIRAPAGSLAGVSGFQLHFSSYSIHTPGDAPSVLVAMNPAALRTNLKDLTIGGVLVLNSGTFTDANLKKAGYETNPQDDNSLKDYRVLSVDISKMTSQTLTDSQLSNKEKLRCKNFFALGLILWAYGKDLDRQIETINKKFATRQLLADANIAVLKAGYHFGETTEIFSVVQEVKPAPLDPGIYRNVTGNEALCLGLITAGQLAKKNLFLGAYPITPASDILHILANHRDMGVTTFQAEDEIAAISAAIGAAFGGAIAITSSSGPGIALKGEAIGLATIVELPLVIINVQRGGPSTGLPTKTEQSDLLQAMYGRNGECPIPIIASKTPSDNFKTAIDAVRIAIKYMTPIMILSDGYLANGTEPWRIPDSKKLQPINVTHRTDPENFLPYQRNTETLARDWAIPGTPGLEHRIGGLEKDALTGNVSYDPQNHEAMCRTRAEKITRIQQDMGAVDFSGDETGDLLLIGWGGTYGALFQATQKLRKQGHRVSHLHVRYINPLHPDLGKIMSKFKNRLVCELNLGQLSVLLRNETLLSMDGYNKVQGHPFSINELCTEAEKYLKA